MRTIQEVEQKEKKKKIRDKIKRIAIKKRESVFIPFSEI